MVASSQGPAIAPGPPIEQYAPATPVRILPYPHPLSSRTHAAFLTAPLNLGGAQRPPP